jgi:hypothetical protein
MVSLRQIVIVTSLLSAASVAMSAQVTGRRPQQALDADLITFYKLPDGRVFNATGHYYQDGHGRIREDIGNSGRIVDVTGGTLTMLNHVDKRARVVTVQHSDTTRPTQAGLAPFARGSYEGYQITKARTLGANGEKYEVWTADSLGLVVMSRTESMNFITTRTLRNIKERQSNPSVFTVPSDYSVSAVALPDFAGPGRPAKSAVPNGRGRGQAFQRR